MKVKSIQVKCPNCKAYSDYLPTKDKPKRRRKRCPTCHKTFTVKSVIVTKLPQQKPQAKPQVQPDGLDLQDPKVKAIMKLAQKGLNQKQMASQMGLSEAAISRRLKILVKKNYLFLKNKRPNLYEINPNITKINFKAMLRTHNFEVTLKVIGNEKEYEALRNKSDLKAKLNNWLVKKTHINNAVITLNLHRINFFVQGFGYSNDEIESNAKSQAVNIWQDLSKKYNLKLNFPEFYTETGKRKNHIVIFPEGKEPDYYLDKSDQDGIETTKPEMADLLVDTINNQANLNQKIEAIETNQNQLAQSIDKLTNVVSNMSNNLNSLAGNMNQMAKSMSDLSSQIAASLSKNSSDKPGGMFT